jgi:hypothetical protein
MKTIKWYFFALQKFQQRGRVEGEGGDKGEDKICKSLKKFFVRFLFLFRTPHSQSLIILRIYSVTLWEYPWLLSLPDFLLLIKTYNFSLYKFRRERAAWLKTLVAAAVVVQVVVVVGSNYSSNSRLVVRSSRFTSHTQKSASSLVRQPLCGSPCISLQSFNSFAILEAIFLNPMEVPEKIKRY